MVDKLSDTSEWVRMLTIDDSLTLESLVLRGHPKRKTMKLLGFTQPSRSGKFGVPRRARDA
jgi:hypothetical protein